MRLIGLLISCMWLSACGMNEQHSIYQISGPTMGTQYHISWVGQDPKIADMLKMAVNQRLIAINKSMSTYDPDSELSLINQGTTKADAEGWLSLSPDLNRVMDVSLDIWKKSEGRFDISIGPLVNLWGFGPLQRPETIPTVARLHSVLADIGSQYIQHDVEKKLLKLRHPLYLDLSGVAKGWAVDEIAAVISAHGIESFMAEIGGEIYAQGLKPNRQPWRIAIERPDALNHQNALIIELDQLGVATSGNYRNYFEEEGVRYSHTIDPTTGYPIRHNLASVTVVHEDTGIADAWATAITVAGVDEGLQLAERYNLAVYLLAGEGQRFKEYYSSQFKQQFPQVEGGL